MPFCKIQKMCNSVCVVLGLVFLLFVLSSFSIYFASVQIENAEHLAANNTNLSGADFYSFQYRQFYSVVYGQLYRYALSVVGMLLLLFLRVVTLPARLLFLQDTFLTTLVAVITFFCFITCTETALYETDTELRPAGLLICAALTRLLTLILFFLFFWTQPATTVTQFYTPPITYTHIISTGEHDLVDTIVNEQTL